MFKIAFASGKGGAGKTSLSLSFHKYLGDCSLLADCDVDAADAFLLIEKDVTSERPFQSGYKYFIDEAKCTSCGKCKPLCTFNAITSRDSVYKVEELSCEGCGMCELVCPENAFIKKDNLCGILYQSNTILETNIVYARLIPGEDNSGKLVQEVKTNALTKANQLQKKYLIIDCPPGIGCPLMASLAVIDFLVIIIECSKSGFADATRLVQIVVKLNIPYTVILNKSRLNPVVDNEIHYQLMRKNTPTAGEIPFDRRFIDALNQKKLLIDCDFFTNDFNQICRNILIHSKQI